MTFAQNFKFGFVEVLKRLDFTLHLYGLSKVTMSKYCTGDPPNAPGSNSSAVKKMNAFQLFSIGKKQASAPSKHSVLVENSSSEDESNDSFPQLNVNKKLNFSSSLNASEESVGANLTSEKLALRELTQNANSPQISRKNVSYGSNLSSIDESLEIVDEKSARHEKSLFPGISKSFSPQFANCQISQISSPFNDSTGLNVSCDVSVLNVTRSKNGRRKSVLGKNVVYLLSSDSDASDSDKENDKEKNYHKDATPDVGLSSEEDSFVKFSTRKPKICQKRQVVLQSDSDDDVISLDSIKKKFGSILKKNSRQKKLSLGESSDEINESKNEYDLDDSFLVDGEGVSDDESGTATDEDSTSCSESEEETDEKTEDESERKKILQETDLEDSWLVPDGVEIKSESEESSSDEQIKKRFNLSDRNESSDMPSKYFNFLSGSESDQSPERRIKPRKIRSIVQHIDSDSDQTREKLVKPGKSRNFVEIESDSEKTPEKPFKSRTKKIPNKIDSGESPEKAVKTKTKKKAAMIYSDSDKTPEKPVKTKTKKKSILSDSDSAPEKPIKPKINKKASILIDVDSDQTPEKPVKPKINKKAGILIDLDSNQTPAKPVKTKTAKKAVPNSDKTSDIQSKTNFDVIKPKPDARQIQKLVSEVRTFVPKTFVPKTFLQSLNEDVSCPTLHPEAYKYLDKYNKHKQELAERLFALFNREVFSDQLPQDTEIFWSGRLVKTAGRCHMKSKAVNGTKEHVCRIELSSKVLDSCDRLRDTLIHEMCHAACWIISDCRGGHGPLWKSWGNKSMRRFPELPCIDRCHTYKIRTRFVYQCEKCAQQYGRHSKSLDTSRKCCGKCRGKLQLLVASKQNGKYELQPESVGASSSSQPPKTPNAFALFVKDNYKHCRTPGSSHKDAMALLSQKFSKTKI